MIRALARSYRTASPWTFMGLIIAPFLLLAVASALAPDPIWQRFAKPLVWDPIVYDLGYNPVNTLLLAYLAIVSVGWYLALLRAYGQHADARLALAAALFYVFGSTLRVLEDADFFSPFWQTQALRGVDVGASCSPGLGEGPIADCFGSLFVTPTIWIWAGILLFLVARVAYEAQIVGERLQARHGTRFYAWSAVGLATLVLLFRAAPLGLVRPTPFPWLVPLATAVAILFVRHRAQREGNVDWRWGLAGSTLILLAWPAQILATWILQGPPPWARSGASGHPWVLVALPTAMIVVAATVRSTVLALSRVRGTRDRPLAAALWLIYAALAAAAASFALAVLLMHAVEGEGSVRDWALLLAPFAFVLLLLWFGRAVVAPRLPSAAPWAHLASLAALAMLAAQVADGLMTAIALDLYAADEKHVLARNLIEVARRAGFAPYPAAVAMLTYKVLVTLALAWVLEARLRPSSSEAADLRWLVRLLIIAVGLVPAARDTLRVAIGV